MRHLSAPRRNVASILAEQSDEELVSRFIADGYKAAFETLIERYKGMVRSVCWHALHHPQDAEDAFQQTLLVVMRKAKFIRNGESFKSWLHCVASSTAKDFRKSRERRQNHEREGSPAQSAQSAQAIDEPEQSEMRALINAEVQRLPEKYRLPFVVRFVEGNSRTETAALLGLTKGMVAQRVKKAREILRGNLAHRGIDLSK